jgi:hypothetical protein
MTTAVTMPPRTTDDTVSMICAFSWVLTPLVVDELKHDMAHLRFISDQIDEVEKTRLARLREEPKKKSHAMVGIETADMLTHEVFLRN